MNQIQRRLSARYTAAEERVEAAETDLEHASARRLTELMELPPLQRLQQIEDPILIAQDRVKLRRTVETILNPGRRRALKFPARSPFRRSRKWLRYMPALVLLIATVAPLGMLAYRAWENTDQVVPLLEPINLDWTLPNRTKQRKTMPAGGNLAIRPLTSTSAIARRWIEREGYATAEVNIR
jgi:hypothetical protein